MYESTATDEDLELDRYGLGEGVPVSGAEDSDVEEILYSQIHYNLADSEKVQTDYSLSILSNTKEDKDPFTDSNRLQNDDGRTITDCLEEKTTAFTERSPGLTVRSNVRSATTGNPERTGTTIRDLDKQQTCADTLTEAKCNLKNRVNPDLGASRLSIIVSDGERDGNDSNDSKYAIGKKNIQSTTNAKAGTVLPSNSDGGKSCNKRNEVIDLCVSSGSDVIFLGRSLSTQKPVPLKSKQREAKLSIDGKITTVTKINRDSLLPKKKRKRKRKKKGSSPAEDDITAEGETNDDSDAIAPTKEKQKSVEPGKRRKTDDEAGKGQTDMGSFFLDNKGMNLDGVKGEMNDSATSWRKERERTKEMLRKEKGNLIRIIDSSDDDCMAIESHSEDEGLHVHFDGKAGKTGTLERASSGSWSEKRKRSDRKPEVRGRYFVQSRQKNVKCHNCFEVGHLKIECPKPRHIPACILCGTRGHTDKSCPDALCFNCSLPGHQSWACKIRNMRHAHCSRCDMPGHVRKMCTDHWRQYHMTTEKEVFLSPTKRSESLMDQLRDTYCSNCSRSGHRYYDCSAARFDEFTTFTYDGVAKYDARFKEIQRSNSDEAEGPPAKRRALRTRDYQAASTSNEYVEREDGYYETVHSIYRGVLSMQNPGFFSKSTGNVERGGEQHYDEVTSVQKEPLREDDRQMMAAADLHMKEEEEYYEAMNSAYAKDPSKVDATKKSRKRKKSKKSKREVEWRQHDDRTSQEAIASNHYPQFRENLQESRVVEAYAQVDPQDDRRQRKRKHEYIEDLRPEAGYDAGLIRTEANLAFVNDRQPRPSYSGLGEAEEAVSTTSCLPVKRLRKVIQTKVKAVLDLDKQQSKKSQNKGSAPINVPVPVPPMHGQRINYPTSFNAHSTATKKDGFALLSNRNLLDVNGIIDMNKLTEGEKKVWKLAETQLHRQKSKPIQPPANQTQSDVAPQRSYRGFFLNEELLPSKQKPQGSQVEAGSTLQRPEANPKVTTQPCPPTASQRRSVNSDGLAVLSNRNILDDNGIIDMNKLTEGEKKVWKLAETQFHRQKRKPIQPPALNFTQKQPPALNSTLGQPPTNPTTDSFARRYLAMSKKERKVHTDQWNQYTDAFVVDLDRRNLWNGKSIDGNRMTAEERAVWKLAQHKFHKLRKGRAWEKHRTVELGLPALTKKQLKSLQRTKEKKRERKLKSRFVQQVPATNTQASASAMYAQDFPRNANPSQNRPGLRRDVAPQRSYRGFFLDEELLLSEQNPQGSQVEARSTLQRPEAKPKCTTQPCPPTAPQTRSVNSEKLALAESVRNWSNWRKSGFYNTFIKDLSNRNLLDGNGITNMNQLTEGEKKLWKFAETQFHTQKKRKQIQPPAQGSQVEARSTLQRPEAKPKGTTQPHPPAAPQMRSDNSDELALAESVQNWSNWRKSGFYNTFFKDLNNRNLLDDNGITNMNQLTEGEKKLWKFAETQYHTQKKRKPIQPPALNSTQRQPSALNSTQRQPPALNSTQRQPPTNPTRDSFACRYLAMSKKERKVHKDQWNQYTDAFVEDLYRRNLWKGKKGIDFNRMTSEEMAVWKHAQDKFHKLRRLRGREEHQQRQTEPGLPALTKKQLKSQRRIQERNAKKLEREKAQFDLGVRRSKRDRKPSSAQQKRDCFVS